MSCDEARRLVVVGAGWLRGRSARRHVRQCAACAEWLAVVDETAALMRTVPAHEPPPGLPDKLQQAARDARPLHAARPKEGARMRRLAYVSAGIVLATGMALAVWRPMGGIALADLRQAWLGAKVVHMVGEDQTQTGNRTLPLAMHKDKWLRSEPFAVYERVTPADPRSQPALQGYVFAGNRDHTYWYFPAKGNRAIVTNGLTESFVDQFVSLLRPAGSQEADPALRAVGHDVIDGRDVVLLEAGEGGTAIELAVDAKTKLTCRLRQFEVGPDGKRIELTRLRFTYNETPPAGVFEWQPPAGATVVDKRRR